jgi:ectoine hydroxylase-related dioxygenase (phytanoyl-CoA dioxygenase family)
MNSLTVASRMNLPWVESPFFETLLAQKDLTPHQREQATFYHQEGFLVVKNAIDHALIDRTVAAIADKYPANVGQEPARHQDLWKTHEPVRELAGQPAIADLLRLLYGREPIPFQTLNFKFGTQQRAHSDTIHFSCTPARFMCGVWVALEATHADNGPLFYYPRSHREEEFNYFDLGIEAQPNYGEYPDYESFIEAFMDAKGYPRQEVYLEKGDVLIWSSNLVHGGTPIRGNNLTRWSQVTHYYFEGCMYFSPRLSDMFSSTLNLRHIVNINTGAVVQHSENGKPIDTISAGNARYAVSRDFQLPRLAKEVVKKLLGKKPF